jgi:hypothetical protein
MSVLSSFTTAVHTFHRSTSNCTYAPPASGVMRKTIATVVILGFVWIGYVAWAIYDLLMLVRALDSRDVDTVTRYVYSTRCVCRKKLKNLR